jgi:putative spermidine/putrescine transport system substrate-binding protein
MRRTLKACAAAIALAVLPGVAVAQNISFYDTMSGANFVEWWQTTAIPACQAQTQAAIRYTSAGSPEVLQRLKAAGAQGGDIDVLFLAPDKIAAFKGEGVLEDLRAHTTLIPNLAKTEPPDNDNAAGTPLEGTGAAFFRYSYALIYNADRVANPPHTWKELFDRRDEWKGRISYVDPRSTVSGSGRFFVAMFLRSFGSNLALTNGQEDPSWGPAWARLKEFEAANARKHAESGGAHVAQFATGEIAVGFHALDFALYSRKLGTVPPSIRTVLLEDGVPEGAGYLAIARNIPPARKDAAARFINCALSDDIQVPMVKEMYEFPGTNVWAKLPPEVYQVMPTREIFDKSRAPDPSAAALQHISEVWAEKVGY